jgi:hypothetical protein
MLAREGFTMTFASLYAILVGIAMIGQWSSSIATKRVPELKTEPFRIAFHDVASSLMFVGQMQPRE